MEGLIYLLVAVFVLWIVRGMLKPLGKNLDESLAAQRQKSEQSIAEMKAARETLERLGQMPIHTGGGSGGSGGVPPKA